MYTRYVSFHKDFPDMTLLEDCYIHGLLLIPIYEHLIGWLTGLNERYPFIPLLLYSTYCAVGVLYCFIRYYIHALLDHKVTVKSTKTKTTTKSKTKAKLNVEKSSASSSKPKTKEPSESESLLESAKTMVMKPAKQKKSKDQPQQNQKKHK